MFLFSLNFKQVYSLQLRQSKNVSRHCVSPWSGEIALRLVLPVQILSLLKKKKKKALVELKKKCNVTSKHV